MEDIFDQLYSKEVLEHFKHPKNIGVISKPDGVATVGNPVCGDIMKIYIKVDKRQKEEFIKDIKFQTLGCGAAIATSSIITVIAKGQNLKEALKINGKTLVKKLGGLPPAKIHCSVLADKGLKKAIKNYWQKQTYRVVKKSLLR